MLSCLQKYAFAGYVSAPLRIRSSRLAAILLVSYISNNNKK